ncbi:MAG: phosphoribosyl-ATP diphosphatase [Janthinobacterium lividum]
MTKAKTIKAIKTDKVPKTPKILKSLRGRKPPTAVAPTGAAIMDRLWSTVVERRSADPEKSHSARLLARGTAKVAQKFGEEAVECLIEAVANNPAAVITESADVLYHLTVLWVAAGVEPAQVWAELERREGVSGIAEKAARMIVQSKKIP